MNIDIDTSSDLLYRFFLLNLVYFDEKGNKLTGVLNLGSMHYGQGTLYYTVNNGIYAGIFTAKCKKQ